MARPTKKCAKYDASAVAQWLDANRPVSPIEAFLKARAAGASLKNAAGGAGIDLATIEAWLAKYPNFAAALKLAEGQAVAGMLEGICGQSKGWQGAAWILERCFGYVVQKDSAPPGGDDNRIEIVMPAWAAAEQDWGTRCSIVSPNLAGSADEPEI